jgi:hypothetical protein
VTALDSARLALAQLEKSAGLRAIPLDARPYTWIGRSWKNLQRTVAALEAGAPAPPGPSPAQGLGTFAGNGVFARDPRGGVEDTDEIRAAGFRWFAVNVGDFPTSEWSFAKAKAEASGLIVIPWARVRNPAAAVVLEDIASTWGSRAVIHNLEAEAVTTLPPATLAQIIRGNPARERAVSTEPWLQNGAGWQALGGLGVVCQPQVYTNQFPIFTVDVCVAHAKAEGMPLVAPTFPDGLPWAGDQLATPPGFYLDRWPGPFSVYPIDSHDPARWRRP